MIINDNNIYHFSHSINGHYNDITIIAIVITFIMIFIIAKIMTITILITIRIIIVMIIMIRTMTLIIIIMITMTRMIVMMRMRITMMIMIISIFKSQLSQFNPYRRKIILVHLSSVTTIDFRIKQDLITGPEHKSEQDENNDESEERL